MLALSAASLLFSVPREDAQTSNFVSISPEKVTMLVGETRSFRLVDQNGRMQTDVSWSVSDSAALDVQQGVEVTITAKQAGDFHLDAMGSNGSATATVTVKEGDSLPVGTVKWSAGKIEGCKSTKIIPAVPSANGPDIYEMSQCEDGQYVAAYKEDGILMWRRKMNNSGQPFVPDVAAPNAGPGASSAARLNVRSGSVCDAVSVGTEQDKIRKILDDRHAAFSANSKGDNSWTIEESNTECTLWFDDKLVLTKKRKTFQAQ
jgi:hypothetical protein